MTDHPIQGLMSTALSNIKDMVDVNTIIGDPITTPDGTVILPVSKVCFGFASGGSDYPSKNTTQPPATLPFGGGSGAGVTITPIAFLVVSEGNVKLMQISDNATAVDKIVGLVPDLIDKISSKFKKDKDAKEEADSVTI